MQRTQAKGLSKEKGENDQNRSYGRGKQSDAYQVRAHVGQVLDRKLGACRDRRPASRPATTAPTIGGC